MVTTEASVFIYVLAKILMIESAEHFKKLRLSENLEEQRLSALDAADTEVWYEVINKYPELKKWVVANKTVQIEILEHLATDPDPKVRYAVARKRKINDSVFNLLKCDPDDTVRHSLLNNTKLPLEKKKQIKVDDSDWLAQELNLKI
ncbi:MAG: hypothetical protein ACO1OQ_01210 [Rufibacter sp.]